ncbi:MAG: GNAT family N-acetyltransferase [Rhodospirillales bacterium]
MSVHPVAAAHAEALAAIHAAAFPPDEVWSATVIALHVGLPGGFGFIDARGGMVLARTIVDEAEILTIGVLPEVRRQGLGRDLLTAAMLRAAATDARAMFLEVAEENTGARKLYTNLGFVEVGRRKRYYANGDDALVMRVALMPPAASTAP